LPSCNLRAATMRNKNFQCSQGCKKETTGKLKQCLGEPRNKCGNWYNYSCWEKSHYCGCQTVEEEVAEEEEEEEEDTKVAEEEKEEEEETKVQRSK
jgi:hypothetical protein